MPATIQHELRKLFSEHRVLNIGVLKDHFGARSQRSLFRDMKEAKSLSSYSHAGKYYTLRRIAKFNAQGLWHYKGVGFSEHNTLRATVVHFVETSEAGCTYAELNESLVAHVGNVLRELVEDKLLRREGRAKHYLYFSTDKERGAKQRKQREQLEREALLPIPERLIIEILGEVIRGNRVCAEVDELTGRLIERGVKANSKQVALVLELYAVKKTLGSN